jgi:SAM-dependent methyltransferase
MATYIYDTPTDSERLTALEAWLDPSSIEHIERIGIARGWRCLEVGGGCGSIASWLAEGVGPQGHVVVTDVDTRFLEGLHERLEVRRHDIATDPLEESSFDLVHARAVLAHLPERDSVLARLVAALRPGGWILIEDVDFGTSTSFSPSDPIVHPADAARIMARANGAVLDVLRAAGVDPEYGQVLPARLLELPLVEVGAEARSELVRGGSSAARVLSGTLKQLEPALMAQGWSRGREELDEIRRWFESPAFACMSPVLVSAWGRRPV